MNETTRTRLYEPGWQYVPHDRTDIRVLFNRVRATLQQKQPKPASNVQPLRKTK